MAKAARERLLGLAMPETTKQLLQKECDRDHKEWEISEEEVWEMASFHGAAYAQSSYGAAAAAAQAQKAIESSRRSNLSPSSGSSTSITSQRYVVASAPMKVPDAELAIRAGSTGTKQRAARSLILVGKKVGEGVFGKLHYVDDDDEDDDYSFGSESLQKPVMIPPHLIMSQQTHMASSVVEGVGRTLKGRDLRNVRNAVWKHTGFFG